MIWQSSEVEAGDNILATQYNNLRTDVAEVLNRSVPIGTVVMWAGNSTNLPSDWLVCDGSAINRQTYSELYTIQRNVFGAGDGSTTFNIPDMRDRFVVGAGSSYSPNSTGGENAHKLTVNEIPSHNHSQNTHSHSASSGNAGNHSHTGGTSTNGGHTHNVYYSYSGGSGSYRRLGHATANSGSDNSALYNGDHSHSFTTDGAGNHNHSVSVGNATATNNATGGSLAHENRPPYIGILFIIKAS